MTPHATVASPFELAPILDLADPIGVLTLYVDADPALAGGRRPAWQAPIRTGLRKLVKDARRMRPRDEWLALETRLVELKPVLDEFLDPRGPSRGRALFAAVDGPVVARVDLRASVSPLVELGRSARVLPLLAALQHGQPAGVAVVSWDRIETAEWELGVLHPLETIELAVDETPNRRTGTNPAVPQLFPERDRFAGSAGARVLSRLRDVGADLARHAASRGWDVLVAEGDPRLLGALADGLGNVTCDLAESTRPIGRLSAADAVARVEAVVGDVRAERVSALAERLESAAASTSDPSVLERSLDEGRVETLLLTDSARRSGSRRAESWLRRAFDTGADVRIVGSGSADLGPTGAAALLRW